MLTCASIGAESSPERGARTLKIRRSRLTSISIADSPHLDLKMFFSGRWHENNLPVIQAFSPVSNQVVPLESDDIEFLLELSGDSFREIDDVASSVSTEESSLRRLTDSGIVLTDADKDPDRKFRNLEAEMIDIGWNLSAANYHCFAKWTDVFPDTKNVNAEDTESSPSGLFDRIAKRHGPPPPHFYGAEGCNTIDLPLVQRKDGIFGELLNRQSDRDFDQTRPISRETLATVLYYVFGCTGYGRLSDELVVLKKCAPSGGSMHETEAFLLLANVEDVPTGIYHYNVENHALTEVELMSLEDVRSLAALMTAGQHFLATAPVLAVFISRFDRLFWKYRDHRKAYKVSLMDAAHLSQNLYLVCTSLGLGACYTAAVRDTVVEEKLNLSQSKHGVAGIAALGWAASQNDSRNFKPAPYTPRSTKI